MCSPTLWRNGEAMIAYLYQDHVAEEREDQGNYVPGSDHPIFGFESLENFFPS